MRLASGAGTFLGGIAALATVFGLVVARNDATIVFWVYISGYRWLFGE
jgi:hypothetical protein